MAERGQKQEGGIKESQGWERSAEGLSSAEGKELHPRTSASQTVLGGGGGNGPTRLGAGTGWASIRSGKCLFSTMFSALVPITSSLSYVRLLRTISSPMIPSALSHPGEDALIFVLPLVQPRYPGELFQRRVESRRRRLPWRGSPGMRLKTPGPAHLLYHSFWPSGLFPGLSFEGCPLGGASRPQQYTAPQTTAAAMHRHNH